MGKPDGGHTPSPEREPTQGTDTSKYLVEKKSTEILQVAASERGIAQTGGDKTLPGSWGPRGSMRKRSRTRLERRTREGESPLRETRVAES
jgi:hypothetical protein